MTVGIYVRVSTQEQATEGYSIDAQKERLLAFCQSQGWTDFRFYIEEGVSAQNIDRPKLKLLMDHIKGGQIKTLLVYRLDRLTRSVIDLHKLLKFLQKYNCSFKSATEPYDTTTANGRMFMGLVALLAQWETENMSERIKMALEQKVLEEKERVGNVPYGFDLSEDEKLIKNDNGSIVMDMIQKVESGWSVSRVARYLNLISNDRTWYASTVLRLLRNPALYGATRWNDKVVENTHEGYISKDRFMKLQKILDDRSQHFRREVQSTYLFQGVLVCPYCESTLSVNRYIRKRKDGTEYQNAIYRCKVCYERNGTSYAIGEQRIIEALKEYMKSFQIKPIEPIKIDNEQKVILDQLKQVEKKREKYQKAWASDLISDEEFEKLMNETRGVYDELKRKLEEFEQPNEIDVEKIQDIVFNFNETFDALTTEEKQEFVSRFIRNIYFKMIPQGPQRPDKAKKGKPKVEITEIEFY